MIWLAILSLIYLTGVLAEMANIIFHDPRRDYTIGPDAMTLLKHGFSWPIRYTAPAFLAVWLWFEAKLK